MPVHISDSARGYIYPHDYPGNFVNQAYRKKVKKYYEPGNNKFENHIREKIEKLWKNRK